MVTQVLNNDLMEKFARYFFGLRDKFPDEIPSFKTPPYFGLADKWMESMAKLFLGIPKGGDPYILADVQRRYHNQHRAILLDTAKTIRQKRTYSFFLDVIKSIEKRFNLPFPLWVEELKEEPRPTISSFLLTELLLLWVLMEKKERFLVCVKGEHQRKYFPLPYASADKTRVILEIGQHILTVLPFITLEHLDLIPENFGPIHGVADKPIHMPTFDQSIEDIIADAKLRQRYIVSPEGACVQWKKGSGDLKEMFVKVIEDVVIAKVLTNSGETLALIDLETARGIDFIFNQEKKNSPVALALASVYHDLVTREEIKVGRESRLGFRSIKTMEEASAVSEEGPTVVYIPRKVVIGGKTKRTPLRLLAFRKSPIEHLRHMKQGRQMSEHQRRLVEEYERKHKVRILNMILPGCTFVLPHCRQEGKVLYIKSGMEARLAPLRAG